MAMTPMDFGGSNSESVSTGISSITARQNLDKTLALLQINTTSVTLSSQGWYSIGQLPQSLRPAMDFDFVLQDNRNHGVSYLSQVNSNGYVRVYLFSGHLSAEVRGSVMYYTA